MWLLLASGCLAPPDRAYDAYVADLGILVPDTADTGGPGPTDPPTPPPPTPPRCSTDGGDPVVVELINEMGFPIDVFYVRSDCTTQNTALVRVGDGYSAQTHVGAVWRAWDAFGGTGFVDEVQIQPGDEIRRFAP